MRSVEVFGGRLYYGLEHVDKVIIDGEVVKYPRWRFVVKRRLMDAWVFRRANGPREVLVVNWTHPYLALGMSTSGGLGFTAAFEGVAKMGSARKGDTHTKFAGGLIQAGFWWFKFYGYIFAKGDGLG